jgi:polar amino acid transport system permease protein
LPQAFRFAIPPIGNEFVAMLKDSSLVSATGFAQEILWRAQKAGRQNYHNLEALIVAAILYWIMTLIFSYLQNRIEQRMARGDRNTQHL